MSIQDDIADRLKRGMLHPLLPLAKGAMIRRAMFVGEELWANLNSPEGDPEWDERIGKLQADLEVFVTEASIEPKYLFLLFPAPDAVWEIRSVRDDPSIRVLGLFAEKDVFISTNFARREGLGGWQSREWKWVKRMARALWRRIFPTYSPVTTIDVKEVCSGASNGIFYKERRKVGS
jgi:hypothetical protein